jgi:hypothetical protein
VRRPMPAARNRCDDLHLSLAVVARTGLSCAKRLARLDDVEGGTPRARPCSPPCSPLTDRFARVMTTRGSNESGLRPRKSGLVVENGDRPAGPTTQW